MNLKKLIELYRKDPSKWKDNLKGGLSDKKTPKDFNPKALEEGAKVEVEHVSDPKLALEISTDHLTENPNYYKELKRIEKGLKGDWHKEGYTLTHKEYNRDHLSPGGIGEMVTSITAKDKNGEYAGHVNVATRQLDDGSFRHFIAESRVLDPHQRKGLATGMYRLAEKKIGGKLDQSSLQSEDAQALWKQPNRSFGKSNKLQKDAGQIKPKALEPKFTRPDQEVKRVDSTDPYQKKKSDSYRMTDNTGHANSRIQPNKGEFVYDNTGKNKPGYAIMGESGSEAVKHHEGFHLLTEKLVNKHGIDKIHNFYNNLISGIHPFVNELIDNTLNSIPAYSKMKISNHPRNKLAYLEEKINLLHDFVHNGVGRRAWLMNNLKDTKQKEWFQSKGFKDPIHIDNTIKSNWKSLRDKANSTKPEDL